MPLAAPVTRAAGAMGPRLPACALDKTCESLIPLRADFGHPAHGVDERCGRERVAGLTALASRLDQPRLVQRLQMLRDRLSRDRQLAGQPRRGQLRPQRERAQDLPARWVGERGEDLVYAGHRDAAADIATSFGPQVMVSAA